MSKQHYLYIIEAKEVNRVKIGNSNSLISRLKMLQCHSPVSLEIHGYVMGSRNDMLQLERIVQGKLDEYNVHGEWFDFSDTAKQYVYSLSGFTFYEYGNKEPLFVCEHPKSERCKAIRKSGEQCVNYNLSKSGFCSMHDRMMRTQQYVIVVSK